MVFHDLNNNKNQTTTKLQNSEEGSRKKSIKVGVEGGSTKATLKPLNFESVSYRSCKTVF